MEQEKVSCELLYQSLSNTAACMLFEQHDKFKLELNKINESVGAFRKVKMWLAESCMLNNTVKKFYLNIDTFYL